MPKRVGRRKSLARRIFMWMGYSLLLFFLLGLGAAAFAAKLVYDQYTDLRTVPIEGDIIWDFATHIYDRNGQEMYTLTGVNNENRIFVRLSDIPQHVQDAVIAIEDARFWSHYGIDPYRIGGAAVHDLKVLWTGQGFIQGASTITQQLAKNVFLTHDQTLTRKIKDALLAIELERKLSKQEILEKYLNEIFFGYNFYGIGAAAKGYLGKEVQDLTLAEGALLAGLIQYPAFYDPYTNPDEAVKRQRVVLGEMVRWGLLDPEAAEQAKEQKLSFPGIPEEEQKVRFLGDWYVDYVINVLTTPSLAERYGLQPFTEDQLFQGGYRIYTAMDPELQTVVEEAIATVMDPEQGEHYSPEHKQVLPMPPDKPEEWVQASAVVLDPRTGEVKAIVGGRKHDRMRQLNRATDTYRQPGSTFKPLAAYIPAIEELGYGPGTVVDDAPLRPLEKIDERTGRPVTVMWPENYELKYKGLMPLRYGVEQSVNAMAIRLINQVTPQKAFEYPVKMGITSMVPAGEHNDVTLSMALGGLTRGASALDMASAYGTIANLGLRTDPVVITRIVSREGAVVYEARPKRQQVIRETSAWLMVEMMKDVVKRGTAYYYTQGFNGWPAGGKTGTTEESTDAWFVGFTRNLVTAVWTGYDNLDRARELPWTGAFKPVQLWNYIMTRATKEPPPDWPRPRDIVAVTICSKTGLLPSPLCPAEFHKVEYFARGTEPTRFDERFWTVAPVVWEESQGPDGKATSAWKLWRAGCEGQPVNRVFLVRPPYPEHPNPAQRNLARWVPADVKDTKPTEYCRLPDILGGLSEGGVPWPGTGP